MIVVALLFLLLPKGEIGEWRLWGLFLIFSGHGWYYLCSPKRRSKPCGIGRSRIRRHTAAVRLQTPRTKAEQSN